MRRTGPRLVALALAAAASSADAQILVFPRTAGKSHVIYFDFDWRHIELSVSPPPERAASYTGAKSGTIRRIQANHMWHKLLRYSSLQY